MRLMDYFDHEDEGVPEQYIDDEAMFLEQAGDEMLAIADGCIHRMVSPSPSLFMTLKPFIILCDLSHAEFLILLLSSMRVLQGLSRDR